MSKLGVDRVRPDQTEAEVQQQRSVLGDLLSFFDVKVQDLIEKNPMIFFDPNYRTILTLQLTGIGERTQENSQQIIKELHAPQGSRSPMSDMLKRDVETFVQYFKRDAHHISAAMVHTALEFTIHKPQLEVKPIKSCTVRIEREIEEGIAIVTVQLTFNLTKHQDAPPIVVFKNSPDNLTLFEPFLISNFPPNLNPEKRVDLKPYLALIGVRGTNNNMTANFGGLTPIDVGITNDEQQDNYRIITAELFKRIDEALHTFVTKEHPSHLWSPVEFITRGTYDVLPVIEAKLHEFEGKMEPAVYAIVEQRFSEWFPGLQALIEHNKLLEKVATQNDQTHELMQAQRKEKINKVALALFLADFLSLTFLSLSELSVDFVAYLDQALPFLHPDPDSLRKLIYILILIDSAALAAYWFSLPSKETRMVDLLEHYLEKTPEGEGSVEDTVQEEPSTEEAATDSENNGATISPV